ncbi:12432_t:CDS:2 [Acaulospora colombiana]|uniref:12432_t:CDS:1 n=1 Tax=Acaulospora colombiana TaxID=27376 RepID=A0ACA9K3S7_9GLOM|nr:12432_t:CDS:2 [Acaulospora colombiana]
MADDITNDNTLSRRGRGRLRGVRVSQGAVTTSPRARGRGRGRASPDNPISRGRGVVGGVNSPGRSLSPDLSVSGPEAMDLESRPATPQTSRAPSPTPSLASVSSGIRRLGSLQPELPPPGRLASVRTTPTGHYFLPTSSKVTLRGTRRMTFVPTVPLAHRRPQPTITSDSIVPDYFDNLHNDSPLGDNGSGPVSTRGRGTFHSVIFWELIILSDEIYLSILGSRGRGRFTSDLVASGPFAYGSSSYQPLGANNNGSEFGQPIVEEKKNRSDLAADFESFRDDPWAPDMLYTYDNEKDDNASGVLEVTINKGKTLFLEDEDDFNGKEGPLPNGWAADGDQTIEFDEIFEQFTQHPLPTASKDVITEKSKGKTTDKVKITAEKIKGKEKEVDDNVDVAKDDDSPEGKIGKLVVRRSGRIQMLIGDLVFDRMQL